MHRESRENRRGILRETDRRGGGAAACRDRTRISENRGGAHKPNSEAGRIPGCIWGQSAIRFDTSQVEADEALEIAASLVDFVKDLLDGWEDCTASEQLQCARSCIELCSQLEELGYLCHMGRHKQVLRDRGRSDLVLDAGLLSVRKKQKSDGTRYALIELEGSWATVDGDRKPLNEDSFK